jgi:hypothetical protein
VSEPVPASRVLPFARFLVDEGVPRTCVVDALDLMDRENRSLGALAVEHGLLTGFEAERVAQVQRRSDRQFGAIAVDTGLLTPSEVERLVAEQSKGRIDLGAALLRLGHVEASRLDALREAFRPARERYEPAQLALPPELDGLPLAARVLELVPKCLLRVARLEAHLEPGASSEAAGLRLRASLRVVGAFPVGLNLLAEPELARRVAMGVLGFEAEEMEPELAEDGLGEFLNVLARNAVAAGGELGPGAAIELPQPGVAIARGTPFQIVSLRGTATLYVDPR